ncbi:hypothetical protein BGZ57DRAFT_614955 [Hyaloscypha finlandica]|nr:hypothetical protein BGZ57DRAFT_614955 [Hyaloscypha finlandica]
MGKRFYEIDTSADGTFEWIFEDSAGQIDSNPRLELGFKEWLQDGGGIFHISGKPGSGKSTLMKFLCTHHKTMDRLKHWSGDKNLVFASFFFWKPGNELQRSLLGLVRTLLFHVVAQCRDFIPEVFKEFWQPSEYSVWGTNPPSLALGSREIMNAFNRLMNNENVFADHRFCFFIDGLDEFEETYQTYTALLNSLSDWMRLSQGCVKICVSSRELPIFLQRLDGRQRMRLQDLTQNDIKKIVQETLDQEERAVQLQTLNGYEWDELRGEIVNKAEGVFLWVILTLKALSEGLHAAESIRDLRRKLDSIPKELRSFFNFILDSIPEDQRKKALCTLMFAMNQAQIRSPQLPGSCYLLERASPLLYSFLDEYIDDRDFVRNLALQPTDAADLERRGVIANAQIAGRCRGLLELRRTESYKSGTTIEDFDSLRYRVVFTHRSIPEFLDDHLSTGSQELLAGFDALDACIQTFSAIVKTISFLPGYEYRNRSKMRLSLLIDHVQRSRTCSTRHFESLDELDKALYLRQSEIWDNFSDVSWLDFSSHIGRSPMSILHYAAGCSFHEYVAWKVGKCPRILQDLNGLECLIHALTPVVDKIRIEPERVMKTLKTILSAGVDVNRVPGNSRFIGHKAPWQILLTSRRDSSWMYMEKPRRRCYWDCVELFLEFGGDASCVDEKWLDHLLDDNPGNAQKILALLRITEQDNSVDMAGLIGRDGSTSD